MWDPSSNSNATGYRRAVPVLCALLISIVIVGVSATAANAGALWIEWDRSPEPAVVGYRVSIGTSPGVYTATFDVGSATSFVYLAPDERLYYVAVASYAAGRVVGPLSAPVSGYPRAIGDAPSFYEALWSNTAAARGSRNSFRAEVEAMSPRSRAVSVTALPSVVCWAAASECLSARLLVRRDEEISSLAASADGRLFFVQGKSWIGVVSGGAGPQPVLAADSGGVQFNHISLDSAFPRTGRLYVGETETGSDGSREFRVVRYRVVQNRAGERVVLVRIPLTATGEAQFSVSQAHIDVAVPAASDGRPRDGYAGTVLRFNLDGTVPRDRTAGSPVIAMGYPNPTGQAFDERTGRLWLAGSDDRNQHWVSSVGGFASALSVKATSLSAAEGVGSSLFVVLANGRLGRAQTTVDGLVTLGSQLSIGNGLVRSVASSPSGALFVAVADDPTAGATTSILQLTPIW